LNFRNFVGLFSNDAYTIAGVLENMWDFWSGKINHSWLFREVLEKCDDYSCALKNLAYTPISNLVYITVAGINENEGAVITRNKAGPAYFDILDADDGKWYIVAANNDIWRDNNVNYELTSERRIRVSKEILDDIGQENITI